MQVQAQTPDHEGGVGGAGPNQMKMRSSPGLTTLIIPISACYYLELHSAITSYSGV